MVPIQVSAGPQLRQFRQPPPTVNNNNAVKAEGPPVTVFVGRYFIDAIILFTFIMVTIIYAWNICQFYYYHCFDYYVFSHTNILSIHAFKAYFVRSVQIK